MSDNFGYHLVLDIKSCQRVDDQEHIANFARELVKRIDMVPYGEPQVVHFAEHDIDKAGNTLIQLLQTSNIMAHFLDKNGDCYLDVFSCKVFDPQDVMDVVNEYFAPLRIRPTMLTRQA